MVGKLDKEREAIAAVERMLAERRNRLIEMEREEREKELERLVKRLTIESAIAILTRAVELKPKAALEALQAVGEKAASKRQSEKSLEPA